MDKIRLSPRLFTVAGFVKRGARVADVGTDHGFIPIWLIQNGISPGVYASDIAPGPLSRAEENIRKCGLADSVKLLLCAGLELLSEGDVDEVIIAGMGGETIAGILGDATWTRKKTLILQPMSKPEVLRGWLYDNGYSIRGERLVRDAGVLYSVIKASGGTEEAPSPAELLVGRNVCPIELYEELVNVRIEKIHRAVAGIRSAGNADNAAHLDEMQALLLGLNEILNKMLEGSRNAKRP